MQKKNPMLFERNKIWLGLALHKSEINIFTRSHDILKAGDRYVLKNASDMYNALALILNHFDNIVNAFND